MPSAVCLGRSAITSRHGVTPASRYEPGISRTYQDMASHYGTAVLPARVRRPRDKAKVEVAVQVVQRWVLARLRHRRFFSLAELNGEHIITVVARTRGTTRTSRPSSQILRQIHGRAGWHYTNRRV